MGGVRCFATMGIECHLLRYALAASCLASCQDYLVVESGRLHCSFTSRLVLFNCSTISDVALRIWCLLCVQVASTQHPGRRGDHVVVGLRIPDGPNGEPVSL